MEYFFIYICLCALAAYFAQKKGRDPGRWLIISILISPLLSFILLLVFDDLSEQQAIEYGKLKRCPYCAEVINAEAIKCKHCGESQLNIKPENLNEKELNALISKLKNKD